MLIMQKQISLLRNLKGTAFKREMKDALEKLKEKIKCGECTENID
jgi:hypothetical protein